MISDKVSFLLVLFCFCSVLYLVLVLWKVPRILTYLPSCLAALGPRGKVSDSGCLCVGTRHVLYDSGLFLIHPFSQNRRPPGEHFPKIQKPPLPPATERHDRGSPLPGKKPPVPR